MISIIRLRSQERKERICDLVMDRLDELQESLKDKGQLLYLTKRARHEDVSLYRNIATASLPNSLKLAYLAYTFHLFEDSMQFSILTGNEETLNNYLADVVEKMPGMLRTTVNMIERTRSLVSYETWRKYSLKHGIVPSWDENSMIGQFQK